MTEVVHDPAGDQEAGSSGADLARELESLPKAEAIDTPESREAQQRISDMAASIEANPESTTTRSERGTTSVRNVVLGPDTPAVTFSSSHVGELGAANERTETQVSFYPDAKGVGGVDFPALTVRMRSNAEDGNTLTVSKQADDERSQEQVATAMAQELRDQAAKFITEEAGAQRITLPESGYTSRAEIDQAVDALSQGGANDSRLENRVVKPMQQLLDVAGALDLAGKLPATGEADTAVAGPMRAFEASLQNAER